MIRAYTSAALTASSLTRPSAIKKRAWISEFSPPVQAILKGLKKFGMFVADNGIEWAISVTPDPRIPDLHAELRKVSGSAFEVVVSPH